MLIGVRLAETMGLSVGQPVLFRTDRSINRLLVVEGIFKSGVQSLDERVAYISLETARPLFLLPSGATNIEIKLKDTGQARPFATFVSGATGLRATPWQDRNSSLADALTGAGADRHTDSALLADLCPYWHRKRSLPVGQSPAERDRHHARLRRFRPVHRIGFRDAGVADRHRRRIAGLPCRLWALQLAGDLHRSRRFDSPCRLHRRREAMRLFSSSQRLAPSSPPQYPPGRLPVSTLWRRIQQ